MKNFNIFDPILTDATCYNGDFYLLGLKGDTNIYSNYRIWSKNGYIENAKPKDRKTDSDKSLTADVLIYTKSSESLDWKTLYKNTKGIYFKKQNESIYIERF